MNTVTTFVLMFAAAMFLLLFALAMPVFGERGKTRKQIKYRLRQIEQDSSSTVSHLIRQTKQERLTGFQASFESQQLFLKLRELIEQSGVQTCVANIVVIASALFLVGVVVMFFLMGSFKVALAVALFLTATPVLYLLFKRKQRMDAFEEQLPEAIDTMKRAIQSGYPLVDSFKIIADETTGPCSTEFGLTFLDISYGASLEGAFNALLARMPSITLMALTTSILIQHETGGNMGEILSKISGVVRGRFRFHRKVKTLSAEGRLSATLLSIIPFVLAVVMMVSSPEYMKPLFDDPRGHDMVWTAFGMMMGGILWMRRILRIEV